MPDNDFATPSQLEQQRAMAKALLEESFKTPEGRSGHFTAVSPLAPFAQMAQALVGGLANRRATANEIGMNKNIVIPPAGGDPGAAVPSGPGDVSTAAPDEDTAAPAAYAPLIEDAATKSGLDKALLTRQIKQESGFNPKSRSPAGAMGISQFMPGTARDLGVDPWKPESAIPGQAKYDSDMIAKFGGNTGLGLAAYNWGPGNMQRWLASGANPAAMPTETRNYVKIITGQPIEAWLAKTKAAPQGGPGPQSALGGQALAFSGEPANAPIQMPGSPAAMSTALAGPEAAAGGPAPTGAGGEAPMKMAGGPAPSRMAPGVAPPGGTLGMTPPRPQVSRDQAVQAAIILRTDPTNPVALSTYQAYQMQNQPQMVKDSLGRDWAIGRDGTRQLINPPVTTTTKVEGIEGPVREQLEVGPDGRPYMRRVPSSGAPPAARPAPTAPEEEVPSLKFAPEEKGAEALPAEITKGPEAAAAERKGMLATPPPAAATAAPFAETHLPDAPTGVAPGAEKTPLEDMTMGQKAEWKRQFDLNKAAAQQFNTADTAEVIKSNKAIQDVVKNATQSRDFVGYAQKLLDDPRLQSMLGPGANLKMDWKSFLTLLGNKDAEAQVGLRRAFEKVTSSGIIGTLKSDYGGLGQIRNKEIELSEKATISPTNTVAANKAVLDIADRTIQRHQMVGKLVNLYMQGQRWDKEGNPIKGRTDEKPTFAGMSDVVNKYLEHHPIYDDKVKDTNGKTELDRTLGLFKGSEKTEKKKLKAGELPPGGTVPGEEPSVIVPTGKPGRVLAPHELPPGGTFR
jgi:soluble lytic murein transglycosylase-like protein